MVGTLRDSVVENASSSSDLAGSVTGSMAARHWSHIHSALVVALLGFLLWMGLWSPWAAYGSWLFAMGALAAFTIIVGHGLTGSWLGVLVDADNRVSLSRFQLFLWTVVILPAMAVIAIVRTNTDPITALDFVIPQAVWLLLGISTTSFLGSPLITRTQHFLGQRARHHSISEAGVSDLFTADSDDAGRLDLARIQMFFFTGLTSLSYGIAIASVLQAQVVPSGLPDIGEGMIMLLGLSHAGYLGGKAVSATR